MFRSETPNPRTTLIRAKKATAEWHIRYKFTQTIQSSTSTFSAINRKTTYWIAWRRPQGGFIKINFNESKSSQGAVGGFIIRSWEGKFIQTSVFNLGVSSILIAKATAMRNEIKAAVQAGFTNIHIEGDNKILIQAVQGHI